MNTVNVKDIATWAVILICLLSAWSLAITATLNRVLQHVPINLIIFCNSVFGLAQFGSYIVIEAAVTGNGFKIAEYSGRQYGFLTAASLCDATCLYMATLAFQNDSGGFVSLLSYMSIVYAYFFDQFMFGEALNGVSLVSALVILCFTFAVAV